MSQLGLRTFTEGGVPEDPASFLQYLKENSSEPLYFEYTDSQHIHLTKHWDNHIVDVETTLKAAQKSDGLTNQALGRIIQARQDKDALQDAWLYHFLHAIHNERVYYQNIGDVAQQYRLFENLQKFMNDCQAGQVDLEIRLRLRCREKLFKIAERVALCREEPPEFVSAAQSLLRDRVASRGPINSERNVPSLTNLAQMQLLESLNDALERDRMEATFALSGAVTNLEGTDLNLQEQGVASNPPQAVFFRIWWKSGQTHGSLEYPPETADVYKIAVKNLAEACRPAPLGMGATEILDEGYRKAGALDLQHFMTDLCPYELGIVEQVKKLLIKEEDSHIACKLQKLNVYAAPGGKFKKHFDTPLGPNHFGSLVICLPGTFKGGELVVRLQDRTHTFNWAMDACQVQWAAFFSDCEHEVKEVTEGYRVTLTYDLFRESPHRASAQEAGSTIPTIYERLKELLSIPAFLSKGAILGVPCSHFYVHNHDVDGDLFTEDNLKGTDRALFQALERIGLQKCGTVILENDQCEYGGISIKKYCETGGFDIPDLDAISRYHHGRSSTSHSKIEEDEMGSSSRLEYIEEFDYLDQFRYRGPFPTHVCGLEINPFGDTGLRERIEKLRNRRVKWYDKEHCVGGDVVMAHYPYPTQMLDGKCELGYDNVIDGLYPHSRLDQVVWLRTPQRDGTEGLQTSYMPYGNTPRMDWQYSRAAILFVVPHWNKRSTQA